MKYEHTQMSVCVRVCVHVYAFLHTWLCMHVCLGLCAGVLRASILVRICFGACACACACTCVPVHECACMRVLLCVYMCLQEKEAHTGAPAVAHCRSPSGWIVHTPLNVAERKKEKKALVYREKTNKQSKNKQTHTKQVKRNN